MALFDLTNSMKLETCFSKSHKTLIDLFLIKKPLSFQKTHVTERVIITNQFPLFENLILQD